METKTTRLNTRNLNSKNKLYSNEHVGTLSIDEANDIAKKITDYEDIELRLPRKIDTGLGKMKIAKRVTTSDENVVSRVLCMKCLDNPDTSFFYQHCYNVHPEMDSAEIGVMWRMTDVRFTRFCHKSDVTKIDFTTMFKKASVLKLLNFFASIGLIVSKKKEKSKRKSRATRPPPVFEEKCDEVDVKGTSMDEAKRMAESYNTCDYIPDVLIPKMYSNQGQFQGPSVIIRAYCYLCLKEMNRQAFMRHMNLIHKEEMFGCNADNLSAVMRRINDVRNYLFYSNSVIKKRKIMELVENDEEEAEILFAFLKERGYVFAEDYEEIRDPCRLVPCSLPDRLDYCGSSTAMYSSECMPTLDVESSSEDAYSLQNSDSECTRSRSSSVCSSTSAVSTGSRGSKVIVVQTVEYPAIEEFPYCVLNAIPAHVEVDKALFSILTKMTDDLSYVPTQIEYNFLLGYSAYSLIVANGSKLNVITKMILHDFQSAVFDESTGLYIVSFETKSTFCRLARREYLCADERVWRALEIFEEARKRRVKEAGMTHSLMTEQSAFFITYLFAKQTKDCDYFLTQFLRMCGISYQCRSTALCSAAWSLLKRNSDQICSLKYAITYYQMLRKKEEEQIGKLNNPNVYEHYTLKKITEVVVEKKKRKIIPMNERPPRKKQKKWINPNKSKRSPKKRGGDRKSKNYLRMKGLLPPESDDDESCSGDSDTEGECSSSECESDCCAGESTDSSANN